MNISSIKTILISGVAAGALVACAETEVSPVTTGTTDGEISSNGLRFADGTPFERADRASVEGTTITLRAVKLDMTGTGNMRDIDRLPDSPDFTSATTKLVDATAVLTWTGEELDAVWWTVDIDGESVTFDSIEGGPVTSDQGNVYYFWVPESIEGSLFVLSGYTDNPGADWENVDFLTVIGLETDPDFLADNALATYEGVNYLWVVGNTEDCTTCWAYGVGDIEINADFAGATIDGNMVGILDATFEGVIEGNGWNADIINSTGYYSFGDDIPDHDVLSVDGQLDGVFYGADGEHTAGTIMTEFIVDDEVDYGLTGIGYFVACEDPVACGLEAP